MIEEPKLPIEAQRAMLVTRYLTPLAIVFVVLGVVLSQPTKTYSMICLSMLVVLIAFNTLFLQWLKGRTNVSGWVMDLRRGVNLVANVAIVYLLTPYWSPIWLLLTLTPLATSIYDSKNKTLVACTVSSALFFAVAAVHGFHSPIEWSLPVAYSLFVFIVSLLVHDLAMMGRD
ncbi:MAG: hypothetical protein HY078_16895 [Elusimicrobia bacterium]|nr:hypothetical protein [Elusimicrobiota bacterium]